MCVCVFLSTCQSFCRFKRVLKEAESQIEYRIRTGEYEMEEQEWQMNYDEEFEKAKRDSEQIGMSLYTLQLF